MQLNVIAQGKRTHSDKIELPDEKFSCEFNQGLVHQVVTAYMAAGRAGTKAQKNRSAVSGGGIKPWRQKGTGRARAGTIRSPLWRGGGVTFAAQPRCYQQKVNKKVYRHAISCIVSELIRQNRLQVIENFKIAEPKTKTLLAELKKHDLEKVTIITDELDNHLMLASRNLAHIDVYDVDHINPVCLVAANQILITVAALKKLEERLS